MCAVNQVSFRNTPFHNIHGLLVYVIVELVLTVLVLGEFAVVWCRNEDYSFNFNLANGGCKKSCQWQLKKGNHNAALRLRTHKKLFIVTVCIQILSILFPVFHIVCIWVCLCAMLFICALLLNCYS